MIGDATEKAMKGWLNGAVENTNTARIFNAQTDTSVTNTLNTGQAAVSNALASMQTTGEGAEDVLSAAGFAGAAKGPVAQAGVTNKKLGNLSLPLGTLYSLIARMVPN